MGKKKPASKRKPVPRVQKPKKLTAKQRRFVEEYMVDLNQTQAAIRAGYSSSTAKQIGFELMQTEHVAQSVSKAMQGRSERTQFTADRVLKELAKLAFVNPRDLLEGTSNPVLKDIDKITEADSAAISEITVIEQLDGSTKVKCKFHDKKGALETLLKHVKDREDDEDDGGEQPLTMDDLLAIATGERKP